MSHPVPGSEYDEALADRIDEVADELIGEEFLTADEVAPSPHDELEGDSPDDV